MKEMLSNPIIVGEILIAFLILAKISTEHSIAKKTLDFSVLQLQLSTHINPEIADMLDNFISACFTDYLFLNPTIATAKYISQDQEKKILDSITELVSNRLSATMVQQLSVYYNDKAVSEIISNIIYTQVTAWVYETNKPRESPDTD